MTQEELERKAAKLTRGILPPDRLEQKVESVRRTDPARHVSRLALLVRGGAQAGERPDPLQT